MICAIILDVCPSWSPRNVSTPTETSIFGIILPQMSPLPILQWYHTENDLQKYPTAHNRPHRYVLLHLNCIEFKSLYLLNRSVVHDKFFTLGDIKGVCHLGSNMRNVGQWIGPWLSQKLSLSHYIYYMSMYKSFRMRSWLLQFDGHEGPW